MENNYFTPTKKSPAFIAECSLFGFIETEIYKNIKIETGGGNYSTIACFGFSYKKSIEDLHNWLCEHKEFVLENQKAKFSVSFLDGSYSVKKYDTIIKAKKVYEITGSNAKLLLF